MVDWAQLIPAIVGSGLVVFVIQFAVNQQVLIPNIDFRVSDTGKIIEIYNVGMITATKVVLTIGGYDLAKPTFQSTDLVNNESVTFSDTTPFQIQVPRLSPGPASYYKIELEAMPESISITYDQGSEKWPKPAFTLVNLVITALAVLGVGLILFSYLRRRYKRQFYRFKFTVKIAQDMYQVIEQLHEMPYLTIMYWTIDEKHNLSSTRKWDVKNEIVGSMLDDKDASLFKEFYSKLVSRDITVNKILGAPYEKRKSELKKKLKAELDEGKTTKPPLSIEERNAKEEKCKNDVEKEENDKLEARGPIDKKTPTLKVGDTYELLSTDMLSDLFEINKGLQLTAKECFHKFGWSAYSVAPVDLTKTHAGVGLLLV